MLNSKVEICGVNTAKLPVLKGEEKKIMFEKVLNGDTEAREKYIYGNLRLVLSIIQRFNNRGEYVDDIFQVGCIGLIKAIDNFDVTQGVQFSTYAVPMKVNSRENGKDCYMTRKQALEKCLEILAKQEQSAETIEIKNLINELIKELPITAWTKETIRDTFNQFAIENGRNVTISDMNKRGLPPHSVIRHRFGMTAQEFLNTYYPSKCNSKIYKHKTKEEWLELFRQEYEQIKPSCAEEYNKNRQHGTPSWNTISKLFDITKWIEFKKFSKVPNYTKEKQIRLTESVDFVVTHSSDLENAYQKNALVPSNDHKG